MRYWTPVAVLLTAAPVGVITHYCDHYGGNVGEWGTVLLVAAAVAGWGAWAGLSTHCRIVRIAVLLCCGFVFVGSYASAEGWPGLPQSWTDVSEGYLLFGGLAAIVIFAVLEFLGLQGVRGSAKSLSASDGAPAAAVVQFSIRGALAGTAAIAMLLAGYAWVDDPDAFLNIAPGIYLANCVGAVLALAAIWLVFGTRSLLARWAINLALLGAIGAFSWWESPGRVEILALPPAASLACIALFSPFRIVGYRLARRTSVAADTASLNNR